MAKFVLAVVALASLFSVGACEKEKEVETKVKPLVSEECLDCLCQLISKCDLSRGCKNGDCGPFGITIPFWLDATGLKDPDGTKRKDPKVKAQYEKCATDLTCSTKSIQKYMELYKRDCNGDGKIDCLDVSAIHIQGPNGCLQKPFPDDKKSFIKTCLDKNLPGKLTEKIHELAKDKKESDGEKDHSEKKE